ncbi:MAG: hypothetical protein ACOCU4_00215 [Alkalispirochaeta sp.]
MEVTFTYNGTRKTVSVVPDTPAHQYLSEVHGRRGTCGDGSCLQCTVLMGNRVTATCTLPAYRLQEAEVVDTDGLKDDALYYDIHRAFEKIGITRCGEALQGLVFLAYQLLGENPLPGDEELREYSRHMTTRCVSRDEFERAVRLAGRVHTRKHRELPR